MKEKNYSSTGITNNVYTIGRHYLNKGIYIGICKGCHKFKRHDKPFYMKSQFGTRYHFEKINEH